MHDMIMQTSFKPVGVFFSGAFPYFHAKRAQTITLALFLFFFSLHVSSAYGSSRTPAKVIAGWVEKISFPQDNIVVKAKLDTGAATSSIHATNIKFFKKDKKRWVRFELVLKGANDQIITTTKLESRNLRRVKIKNHDGDHELRGVVRLDFCFDGRLRQAEFTLTDRSEYIYPVLLGREFLEEVAIVDPSEVFRTLKNCPGKKSQ